MKKQLSKNPPMNRPTLCEAPPLSHRYRPHKLPSGPHLSPRPTTHSTACTSTQTQHPPSQPDAGTASHNPHNSKNTRDANSATTKTSDTATSPCVIPTFGGGVHCAATALLLLLLLLLRSDQLTKQPANQQMHAPDVMLPLCSPGCPHTAPTDRMSTQRVHPTIQQASGKGVPKY
jgi:hypothetical protein